MQAGAKHVYAIEMSSIADQAKEIIRDNGMEGKITIIRGKVEEVVLPVEKVSWCQFTATMTRKDHY